MEVAPARFRLWARARTQPSGWHLGDLGKNTHRHTHTNTSTHTHEHAYDLAKHGRTACELGQWRPYGWIRSFALAICAPGTPGYMCS
eukprot:2860270-Pleurochrysis_carterae.AAC.1